MITNTSPKYSGEPTAKSLATGLATLGRYGDNYMVHAKEGETVVPMEILEANPELKANLFRQMTMMGIEDPNRYVVGNELNSINPVTGQPEFFFKKVFKAVKKVAKKVLPVAAPIIGNAIAPGIGGILASGLATKLTGGSAADAFKSMALSYGIGAIGRGLQSGFTATSGNFLDNFGTGLQSGLTQPIRSAGNLFSSGSANPFSQGIFGSRSLSDVGFFPEYQSGPFTQGAGIDPENLSRLQGVQSRSFAPITPSGSITQQPLLRGNEIDQMVINQTSGNTSAKLEKGLNEILGASRGETPSLFASERITPENVARLAGQPTGGITGEGIFAENVARLAGQPTGGITGEVITPENVARLAGQPTGGITGSSPSTDVTSYSVGDTVTRGNKTYIVSEVPNKAGTDFVKKFVEAPEEGFLSALTRKTGETLSGGNLTGTGAKVLGGAALAGGALFAANALMPEEKAFDPSTLRTNIEKNAYNQWQNIADKNSPEAESLRTIWYGKPRYSATQLASSFGANPLSGITAVAAGGEIVGPGTGTSDSIPAMLSDGEFVMTAKAVRNAGNGDRDVGAARMYDMMNRFERGVA